MSQLCDCSLLHVLGQQHSLCGTTWAPSPGFSSVLTLSCVVSGSPLEANVWDIIESNVMYVGSRPAVRKSFFFLYSFELVQLCFHPHLCAARKRWWVKASWVRAARHLAQIWLLFSLKNIDLHLEMFWGIWSGFCRCPCQIKFMLEWKQELGSIIFSGCRTGHCSMLIPFSAPMVKFLWSCWSHWFLRLTLGL